MSLFITAFVIAEIVSLIVVAITTAGNALEGFGMTAISWVAIWLTLMLATAIEIDSSGIPSYAPILCAVIGLANFLIFLFAHNVQRAFRDA